MNGFTQESEELRRDELAAVERVVRSGWYVLGQEVAAFEKEWAAAAGTAHAVGVGNGMDAIEIGLRVLDIGPGDEVITTPMTAFASVLAILRVGATPVLADIDPDTACLDLQSAARCVSPKTRAVMLVHLYGQVSRLDEWRAFCAERGLLLLEDCAQSHLATWQGAACGTVGQWGAFSFYPTKNLGCMGDGGAFNTSSGALAERAARLRNYGQSKRYYHTEIGLNSRLDEMQAAILRERLKWLARFTTHRQDNAATYFAGLSNPRVRPLARPHARENHVYHLFVARCQERERLSEHLKERGIESFFHYPVPMHLQEPCLTLRRDPQGLAVAERHAQECISLPCHPQMSPKDLDTVIEAVNAFA